MNNGLRGWPPANTSSALLSINGVAAPVAVRALVVGGGGGSAQAYSDSGQISSSGGGGGGGVIDDTVLVYLSSALPIQIGAGGAGGVALTSGSFSRFGTLFAIGGGAGTYYNGFGNRGATGGSSNVSGAAASSLVSPQGFSGGVGSSNSFAIANPTRPGGGGGAGAAGGNGTAGGAAGSGGDGRLSTVPLVPAFFGGGGGAGGAGSIFLPGSGGAGGGAAGNAGGPTGGTYSGAAGSANTGGGGGGAGGATGMTSGSQFQTGAAGGSGIVVLRFNSALVWRVTTGLTVRQESVGSDTILTFTAGTGTITFS